MRKILVFLALCFLGANLFAHQVHTLSELVAAARDGNTALVETIVSSGDVSVNAKDSDGMTALMWAAAHARTETVARLKGLGADLDAKDKYGKTALMWAANAGRTETAVKLVELGADLKAKDNSGKTASQLAVVSGRTETAEKLMIGELMEAAGDGSILKVEKVISSGVDVNSKDGNGMTALMHAAIHDQTEMVEKLKEIGADLDIKDPDGYTAFKWAEVYHNTETVTKLRELGAKGYLQDELLDAAADGNTSEVEKIVSSGVDVNSWNSNRMTPLISAAISGRTETALKLMELGADATIYDNYGITAAKWAIKKGNTETAIAIIKASLGDQEATVEKLKELGLDEEKTGKDIVSSIMSKDLGDWENKFMEYKKFKDENGREPLPQPLSETQTETADKLMAAAKSGNTSEVERLVKSSVKVDAEGGNGITPLMWAASQGHTETVAKLIELGANVNAKSVTGSTPLMFAAANGHTETVVKLVESGADVNAKDNKGRTALVQADINDYTGTIAKLRELGAIYYSDPEILKNDARLSLLSYTQKGAGASDEEIAVKSLSKIYEGLSKEKGSAEYTRALSCIVKEGNMDFLSGVELAKYTSVSQDYLKAVSLFKDFVSFEKARAGKTRSTIDLARDYKINEIKTELVKFKALK